jgi:hypothetical protein
MAQAYVLKLNVPGQLETLERSGTWGFRHGGVMFFKGHIRRLSLAILLLLAM